MTVPWWDKPAQGLGGELEALEDPEKASAQELDPETQVLTPSELKSNRIKAKKRKLLVIMAIRVDDLKIAGVQTLVDRVQAHLEKAFAASDVTKGTFTNCGVEVFFKTFFDSVFVNWRTNFLSIFWV